MKALRRAMTGFMAAIMLVGSFSMGNLLAVVKDPNEPNNKAEKATVLTPGEIVIGELGDRDRYKKEGGDTDWYKVKVTKGKKYRLAVTGYNKRFKSTTFMIVGLTDPANANALWHPDNDYFYGDMGRNGKDYIDFEARKTGWYYIKIDNFVNDFLDKVDTTFYTISIDGMYKDVQNYKDFWYDPTYYLAGLGVVKGYDNGTKFKPDNDCTRAQMVTFLWRLNGSPKPKTTSTKFTDIKKSDYYYNAVLWAVEQGITTGTSKTKFGPSGVCTRGQTVTFLWRMAGKPSVGNANCKFKDVKKGDYFYDAVIWASGKKIVAGYSDGTFKPADKCARRQMVTFLYKYDKYVNGKG